MRGTSAALVLVGCLGGCVLPPREQPRESGAEIGNVGLSGAPVPAAQDGWWRSFDDPQLDELIDEALSRNPTLVQVQARLREALAQAEVARAGLLPTANLDASLLRQHAPQNYLIPPPLAGTALWMGQAGATLSWNIDFWGRQADAIAQARALARAADLDIENTRLMLAGAVAQAYVELYRAFALVDIAIEAAAQRQRILDITRRRVAAGLDTQLEMRQAEERVPQARVERSQAHTSADLAVHQLAAICGEGAEAFASIRQPTLNPEAALPLPAELPINLLARRPDVLAARLLIEAADAQRLAAKAAFYPAVNLRAVAGFGAFGLDNLVSWSARGYGGGPFISLPLFDAGRLRAEYKGSAARVDDAVASYNSTVLQAVQQTADQLTRIDALSRQRRDQQEALTAAEEAYRIGEQRYRAGLAGYLSVLSAETAVLDARRAMVDITANQVIARVSLLLAVGGSFDPASIPPSTAARSIP